MYIINSSIEWIGSDTEDSSGLASLVICNSEEVKKSNDIRSKDKLSLIKVTGWTSGHVEKDVLETTRGEFLKRLLLPRHFNIILDVVLVVQLQE